MLNILKRDISCSLVNLLGLATGICCCILLGLYLHHEMGYDKHFVDHENIYRVVGESSAEANAGTQAKVYFQVGEQLKNDFAEVQEAVRFTPRGRSLFRLNDIEFYWSDVYVADASVFDVFSHQVLHGDRDTALTQPDSIAVSASFANAYFGTTDVIGKVVNGESGAQTITLVYADLPSNTHLKYDVLLYRAPVDVNDRVFQIDYQKGGPLVDATDFTYVVMPPNYDRVDFQAISDLYFERYLRRFSGRAKFTLRYYLESLEDVHFHSIAQGDLPRGSFYFLYSFVGMTLLVLLIACANYVNLATARVEQRDGETRIRHVLGASRLSLILRFVLEAQVFVFLALPCAVLLVALLMELTSISSVIGKVQPMQLIMQPRALALLITGTFFTGLLAGIYPALQQTRGHFSKARGVARDIDKSLRVRQLLLFLQLAISVGVIATTLLMYRQIRFVQDVPQGFDAADRWVLEVRTPGNIDKLPALLNTLNAESSIVSATYSEEMPGRAYDIRPHSLQTEQGDFQRKSVARQRVHDTWIESMGIEVREGRDFSAADFAVPDTEDSPDRKVVVNETLAREMGWIQPIGKVIGSYTVIGVVEDFRFQGPERSVEPLVLSMDQPRWANKTPAEIAEQVRYVTVHFVAGSAAEATERLRAHWRDYFPDQPFAFVVLEDFLAALGASGNQQLSLFGIFGSLCILIATLGLYSMTAIAIGQRGKELAIRRVFGASVAQIIVLFTRGLLKLVVLAGVVASAVSWWVVSEWLQSFHYQQGISVLAFFVATVLMSLVAVVTITVQSLKMASTKPALALRYE